MEKEVVFKYLGINGRMISGSKSGYRDRNPRNLAIFNANVCIAEEGKGKKIWYGDIDITKSREDLKKISSEIGKDLYVLYEMDARFEHENDPIIGKFVYKVSPEGEEELGFLSKDYYEIDSLLRKED